MCVCVCVLHIISRSGFNHNNMRLVANPILCGLRDRCPENNVEVPDRCPENVEVLHKMSRKCRSQVKCWIQTDVQKLKLMDLV